MAKGSGCQMLNKLFQSWGNKQLSVPYHMVRAIRGRLFYRDGTMTEKACLLSHICSIIINVYIFKGTMINLLLRVEALFHDSTVHFPLLYTDYVLCKRIVTES